MTGQESGATDTGGARNDRTRYYYCWWSNRRDTGGATGQDTETGDAGAMTTDTGATAGGGATATGLGATATGQARSKQQPQDEQQIAVLGTTTGARTSRATAGRFILLEPHRNTFILNRHSWSNRTRQ